MKDNPGYSINVIRLLIGQCAQAWNLQSMQQIKCWGMVGTQGCRLSLFSQRFKQQATSVKPQAASFKLQAASYKLQDLRTTKKFHVDRTEVLNADEAVLWMPNMKGYLVW